MSIENQIDRIKANVQDTINTIQSTGVTVPPGANSDNLPGLATALANEKQDKLTGQQGQVVGFDAEGNAVAQSPTSSGVTSFEGRTGAVTAQQGDYTAAMVGAVPTTRKVNGKALSEDVEIGAVDVDVPTDTAALYGLEDATVDQVLQILKNAAVVNSAGDALETILGNTLLSIPGVNIATGSYVGTGTYGSSNPNSLTFEFEPDYVFLLGKFDLNSERFSSGPQGISVLDMSILSTSYRSYNGFSSTSSASSSAYGKKSSDNKTVYWYNTSNEYGQINTLNIQVFYMAVKGI